MTDRIEDITATEITLVSGGRTAGENGEGCTGPMLPSPTETGGPLQVEFSANIFG